MVFCKGGTKNPKGYSPKIVQFCVVILESEGPRIGKDYTKHHFAQKSLEYGPLLSDGATEASNLLSALISDNQTNSFVRSEMIKVGTQATKRNVKERAND